MNEAHLFKVHSPHHVEPGQPHWDPEATHAPLTDEQISSLRLRLMNDAELPPCPHCGAVLEATSGGSDDEEQMWVVECAHCDLHANVRVFARGPKAPTFGTLIVSDPKVNRVKDLVPRSTLSFVVHVVLIYLAVIATQGAAVVLQDAPDTSMVFLTLENQKPDEPEPEPEEAPPAQLVVLNPAPKGFQTLDAPLDIPTDIPPIDLTQRFDPRDFSGEGVEGGIFEGVEGGTGPIPEQLQQHTFLEAAVDEPPERLSGPALRYPEMLRQAGIEGTVIFEFVVGIDGRVERGSIQVINATNTGFVIPAKAVIEGSVFRPGRVRGVPVRVLVRQAITFNIITR
jgi:periplasmic protein TonB